jgi:cytochrome P450
MRVARSDVTLSGTTIHTGEVMMLDILAANRDESVFPHAHEINFDREVNPMVSFAVVLGMLEVEVITQRSFTCALRIKLRW